MGSHHGRSEHHGGSAEHVVVDAPRVATERGDRARPRRHRGRARPRVALDREPPGPGPLAAAVGAETLSRCRPHQADAPETRASRGGDDAWKAFPVGGRYRGGPAARPPGRPATDWAMNATVIEACSCPMFCQCYFNTKPAGHAAPTGHEGTRRAPALLPRQQRLQGEQGPLRRTKLDGAKFWIASDLGGDFSNGRRWTGRCSTSTRPRPRSSATASAHRRARCSR